MSDATPAVRRVNRDSAVRLARTLHDLEWDWSHADLERLIGENPDWRIGRKSPDFLVVALDRSRRVGGPPIPELFLDTIAPGRPHYLRARLRLLEFAPGTPPGERDEALRDLSLALGEVGAPTAAPASADGFGLRWQSEARTLLLQSNNRYAWISMQPLTRRAEHLGPEALRLIADHLPALHDDAVKDSLELYRFEGEPALERRREVFGEVFHAVCGVIGEPTLYGGGPDGPDVRWRGSGDDTRVVRLRGDARRIWVETCPAAELEDMEQVDFEHGGPSGRPGEPSDFPRLPYTWQLLHYGPGGAAVYLPGGRLALNLPHLEEALEILLRALIEQLPVQRPGEKIMFTIASPRLSGGLSFTYHADKGLLLRVGGRDGDPAAVAEAMSADGWKAAGRRWKAEFKKPTERTATEAAALIATELAARGVTEPHRQITAQRVSISADFGSYGFLRMTGLGIERR